ncbi:hypothetical protein SDC9_90685 [bioreactor metagenome]|uniref:Uncharacterized protein n=1 Tax=bioreactor metagenome TaxID=1076179 RepID=A0A644ZTB6_9ZZZZ
MELTILSSRFMFPMVFGFSYSIQRNASVPSRIKNTVPVSTSLVCRRSRRISRAFLKLMMTPKPRPPDTINPMMTSSTNGSWLYTVMERKPPIRSNPALQNAEMLWKIENQIPLPMPYCGMNRKESNIAPASSINPVTIKAPRAKRTTPCRRLSPNPSAILRRSCSETFLPVSENRIMEMVMMPRPPS